MKGKSGLERTNNMAFVRHNLALDLGTACIDKTISKIEGEIIKVIQRTEPELYSNIVKNGIWLAGGGFLLRGIAQRFTEKVSIQFHVAGFTPEEIAPLFHDAMGLDNVSLPKKFREVLNTNIEEQDSLSY